MAQTWYNGDGLYVKYGSAEAAVGKAGEYDQDGPLRVIEVAFDLGDALLVTTDGGWILDDFTALPAGARIEQIIVEVETAAVSSGSGTLNVGLIRTDRSTELDYNGFVAAAATSTINTAGKKLTLINGATAAGALIGTTLAYTGYLTADWDTAAFQSGRVRVRVYFYMLS